MVEQRWRWRAARRAVRWMIAWDLVCVIVPRREVPSPSLSCLSGVQPHPFVEWPAAKLGHVALFVPSLRHVIGVRVSCDR